MDDFVFNFMYFVGCVFLGIVIGKILDTNEKLNWLWKQLGLK